MTNFGDKKSRQMIRRAKRQNPDAIVAATGCYAQVAPDTVSKIEGINIVVGTKHRARIVDIIEDYTDETKVLNAVSDIRHETEFEPLKISKLKDRTRAYVKIQEGCNRYCSYYCASLYSIFGRQTQVNNSVLDILFIETHKPNRAIFCYPDYTYNE